jgi:competence protein ComEA
VGRTLDPSPATRPSAERASAFAREGTKSAGSLVRKVASVAAGMVGLAVIGLVAGAPKSDRVELMSVTPELGELWLAGSAESASSSSGQSPSAPESTVAPVPSGSTEAAPSSAPSAAASPGGGITADGKVVLNRASAAELTRLPGVGEKRAEKILELRQKLGRFQKPTDLLRVKGIGAKGLRKMLPYLVLDPPS